MRRDLRHVPGRPQISCKLWPFEVPDISQDKGVSDEMHLAAKALADSMSLAEVAQRTVLSVTFAFFIAWIVRTLLHHLAHEEQVQERNYYLARSMSSHNRKSSWNFLKEGRATQMLYVA